MHVAIDVLDLAGRRVAQLADEDVEAGAQTRHWTGITSSGAPAASGIYFVRMTTPGGAWHRKVVLSK
jgi:flagellar hook assembly protein FlgD